MNNRYTIKIAVSYEELDWLLWYEAILLMGQDPPSRETVDKEINIINNLCDTGLLGRICETNEFKITKLGLSITEEYRNNIIKYYE